MARYRWVSRLESALSLAARGAPALLIAACASAPPPAPVTEADALLSRKDAGDINIARPELVSEARDLLRRAKTAHSLGDSERATLLAHQATQLFTSAKNLAERDEAERLLRIVNKAAGQSEEERRKAELEAKLRKLEEQAKSSPEAARAMSAIDKARDKQSTALEKGAILGSAGVYFQQGQTLLEAAIDAFAARSYAEATNAGQSAAASFSSAIGAFESEKGNRPKGVEVAVAKAEKPEQPAQGSVPAPPPEKRDDKADTLAAQAKTEAKTSLERAEDARSEALRAGVATSAMIEADDALRMAQRAYEGGQYDRTREKAAEARTTYQLLSKRPAAGAAVAGATASGAAAHGGSPGAATTGAGGTVATSGGGVTPGAAMSLKQLTEKAIIDLELRRAEALGELKDQRCPGPFRETEAMLALAQKRLQAADYEHAYEYALRADERFRACDKLGAAYGPPASAAAQASAKRAEDTEEAARKRALVAIQKAQVESARAQAVNPTDTGVLQGNLLLSNADAWLGKKSYEEAEDSANRAFGVLSKVKAQAPAGAAAPKAGTPQAAPPAPRDMTWESAQRAIDDARSLRSRGINTAMTPSQRAAINRAERLLENAEASLRRSDYDAAGQGAKAAAELYSLALESPGAPSTGSSVTPPPMATQPAPQQPQAPIVIQSPPPYIQAPPVAPAPPGTTIRIIDDRSSAREDRFLEQRIAQMQREMAKLSQQRPVAVDSSWKPTYEKVFRALSLRDRARLRSPDAKRTLSQAEELLKQARAAWQTKRYNDATRFADEATAILGPLAEAKAEQGTTEEIEQKSRKADELIREASVGQQVCEKEGCNERDLAGYAGAKELLASARQAYVDKRYGYATELADKAKQQFTNALLKPKKDAPDPKIEAEKLKTLKEAADASLREVGITKKICDTKSCRSIDGEAWIRATEYLASAQAAYADKRYEVSKELAEKADTIFKETIAKRPEFTIPQGVTQVTRSGSQLRLNPPVKFSKGTTMTMTPQIDASLLDLAKVLIDNKAALKRVTLIGYTDNRGLAKTNQKLSADRASVMREALIQRGAPADLLVADGRGGDNPIADNATEKGRDDNRRIEINIELVEGAK